MGPYLSIVIPAWNEERRLPATLAQLSAFCAGLTFTSELLVVVEPGRDRTRELAEAHAQGSNAITVITPAEHRGKGHAVRSGMRRARGEFIFYMDADLSVPLAEIPRFLDAFARDPQLEVLIGNRAHRASRIVRKQSFLRRTMGKTFNGVLQGLAPGMVADTQCGFKAFRAGAARQIFELQELDGFAFDVEVLLLAKALGFRMVDLPVEWTNSPESKVHIVRDSLRMLVDVAVVRRRVRAALRARGGPAPRNL